MGWLVEQSASGFSEVVVEQKKPDPLELNVIVGGRVIDSGRRFEGEFSIGRSAENELTVLGDDTVHRFHLSLVPYRAGGVWWIEVAANATNRTEVNGVNLLAGQKSRNLSIRL